MNLLIGTYSTFRKFESIIDGFTTELIENSGRSTRYGYRLLVRPLFTQRACEYLKRWGPSTDAFHNKARMLNIVITSIVYKADRHLIRGDYLTSSPSVLEMYLHYQLAKTDSQRRRRLLLLLQIAERNRIIDDLWWMIGVPARCLAGELQGLYQRWINSETRKATRADGSGAFRRVHEFYFGDYDPYNSEMDELLPFAQVGIPFAFRQAAALHMRRPTVELFVTKRLAKRALKRIISTRQADLYSLKVLWAWANTLENRKLSRLLRGLCGRYLRAIERKHKIQYAY